MKKQVLVTVDRGETRVAILEGGGAGARSQGRAAKNTPSSDWSVAELYIERPEQRSIVGNIYKGKVENVLPGLEAAFVDIGLEKNGFLHVDEVIAGGSSPKRGQRRNISSLLKRNQEIVVQAIKDPLKTKGPRLTMQITVPGRYMVYLPNGEGVGVSRRLPDQERSRLRKVGADLDIEKGGVIIRTAARGANHAELSREVSYLFKLHEVLQERIGSIPAPNLVFQEADLPIRVVRDLFSKEFESAVVDDEDHFTRLTNFFKRTAPELADRVTHYTDSEPLFKKLGIDNEIQSTLSRRVDLPSGGYLVIDYAEAFTVIDVNTGSFTGRRSGSLEDTITKTNLEAAKEVVRQLRMRDIGGIIVIDFIDMERARNRTQVLSALNKHLDEDRTKTYVVEISPLGLVEMTRENVTDGVREIMTKQCETCHGEGVVVSEESVAIEMARKLRQLASKSSAEGFVIKLNSQVAALLAGSDGKGLESLEKETGKIFQIERSDTVEVDFMEVVSEGSREEVESEALPFSKGDEMLIEIEEPHRFNDGDAVSKLEGIVVSISSAAKYVGQKKMVRIDRVTRTSAYASLIEDSKPEQRVDADDSKRKGSGFLFRGRSK